MIQTQSILLTQIFTVPHLPGMPFCHFRKYRRIKKISQIKFLSAFQFLCLHTIGFLQSPDGMSTFVGVPMRSACWSWNCLCCKFQLENKRTLNTMGQTWFCTPATLLQILCDLKRDGFFLKSIWQLGEREKTVQNQDNLSIFYNRGNKWWSKIISWLKILYQFCFSHHFYRKVYKKKIFLFPTEFENNKKWKISFCSFPIFFFPGQ